MLHQALLKPGTGDSLWDSVPQRAHLQAVVQEKQRAAAV